MASPWTGILEPLAVLLLFYYSVYSCNSIMILNTDEKSHSQRLTIHTFQYELRTICQVPPQKKI